MRLFFIHGFGETENIFSKLAPILEGEKIYVNLWDSLGNNRPPDLHIIDFARELVQKYSIQKNDIVIGHSLGGWLAHHIKHVNGNRIVQIASWTSPQKVMTPIKNKALLVWMVRRGLVFNSFSKNYLTKWYKNLPSEAVYNEIIDHMIASDRRCLTSQLKLVVGRAKEPVVAVPDLRIHAKKDKVIRYPDEPFIEVTGDHFTLYTHPKDVATPIQQFLSTLKD